MSRKDRPKWATESEMLVAFSDMMKKWGFKVYSETGGHDLLLVVTDRMAIPVYQSRSLDCLEAGDIIAVEGKLQASMTLLRQLIPPYKQRHPGRTADFYVGVVPDHGSDLSPVLEAMGAHLWRFEKPRYERQPPALSAQLYERHRCFGERLALPTLEVEIAPGKPSPRVVTPWKIAAVKICMDHTDGKELLVETFSKAGLRHNLFVDQGWIKMVRKDGRKCVYQLADHPNRPDIHYPEIVDAIRKQEVRIPTPHLVDS